MSYNFQAFFAKEWLSSQKVGGGLGHIVLTVKFRGNWGKDTDLEANTGTRFCGLNTQVGTIVAAIESQSSTLSKIKAADSTPAVASLESQIVTLSTAVSGLKSSDITLVILAAVKLTATVSKIKTTIETPIPAAEKTNLTPL
ncbi:hypothetical protein BKA61DRAFT_683947 [Leptodontidium sp. MPI-SDFR-AT-0119]|nr:hypothetical protein BKA61DRAFT_683947 [Leptodontidium sp. MPI-SDFR-AT-0119]